MSGSDPLVFQIRRFSIDDGPGIRTTVFFKGCPLACVWCHNPEGMSPRREMVIDHALCIGCGECQRVCPQVALTVTGGCTACGICAAACPAAARRVCGSHYPVESLMEILLRDRHFFESSGGGVTLSGGEPTLRMEYAGELARSLRNQGIHVALQTCGYFPWEAFQSRLLPHVNLVFYDLKLIDPAEHLEFTGVGNRLILENLRRLKASGGPEIIVRTPLVPGITDTPANLGRIRAFLEKAGIHDHRLLPFNPGVADVLTAAARLESSCPPLPSRNAILHAIPF
jgi:pyruvate formate lyase activating enzyme